MISPEISDANIFTNNDTLVTLGYFFNNVYEIINLLFVFFYN